MNKLKDMKQLDDKIFSVLGLLEKLNYEYYGTVLSDEERKKLFDFTFKFKGCRLGLTNIFEDVNYPEYVARLNISLAVNLTPEVEAIITKCGVDPHRVFVFAEPYSYENNSRMDPRLYAAMYGVSYTSVGDYFIRRTMGYPGKDEIDYTIKSDINNLFPLIINSNNAVLFHGYTHQTGYPFDDDSENIADYQVTYDCLLDVEEALRRKVKDNIKSKSNRVRLLSKIKEIFE